MQYKLEALGPSLREAVQVQYISHRMSPFVHCCDCVVSLCDLT